MTSTAFRFWVLSLVGVVLPLALLIWVALAGINASTVLFLDDQAFSMMLGELVRTGTMPLLGLPSHLGGRHVGPFYLWIMGLVVAVADGDPVTVTKILTIMKAGAVLLLGSLAYRICSVNQFPKSLSFGLVLLASCCGVYPWVLRVDWANNFLLISSVLALWATYLFFERGVRALSFCAVTWSILLQTHLSAAPFIAGLGFGCMGRLCVGRAPVAKRGSVLLQVLGWLMFVALWIPPVYYEIHYESNLVALFHAHRGRGSQEAGLLVALSSFYVFLRSLIVPSTSSTPNMLECLLVAGLILFSMIGVFRGVRSYSVGTRWFFLSSLLGVFLMVVASSRVQPPIHEYYFYVLLPLWPLLSGIAGSSLYLQGRQSPGVLMLFVGFICCGIGLFISSWQERYVGDTLTAWHTVQHAQEIAPLLSQIEKGTSELQGIPVFFRKSDQLRANAVYYLLGPDRFPLMQFSGKLAEFQKPEVVPRTRYFRRFAARALYIACPRPLEVNRSRHLKRMGALWTAERTVESSSCRTCSACKVTLYKRENAKARSR